MRILLDTDILLDVALKRAEFFRDSAHVLEWAESEPGQAAAALAFRGSFIVTRNLAHYKKSPVPAISPAKLLEKLQAQ